MDAGYSFPIKVPAIKFEQPLGEFYVAKMDVFLLKEVTYSIPAIAIRDNKDRSYKPEGTQRVLSSTRINEIGRFIDSVEATFPNSIILGANYDPEHRVMIEDDKERWTVEPTQISGVYNLVVPTSKRLASLIDGQHRLQGFSKAEKHENMDLLCAVFLDLPFPYHAYVFATINYNQKSVSRSLAYDLFGFDIDEKNPEAWVPETLAVSLTRALEAGKDGSKFKRHIKLGVREELNHRENSGEDSVWFVSLATVVDGILSLLSSNPSKDKDEMKSLNKNERRRSKLNPDDDERPLRRFYVDGNDAAIYQVINNFFNACYDVFWAQALPNSYIKKTIGIQALFDVLKTLLVDMAKKGEVDSASASKQAFVDMFSEARKVNFGTEYFEASGIGKTLIRNIILISCGLMDITDVTSEEKRTVLENVLQDNSVNYKLS